MMRKVGAVSPRPFLLSIDKHPSRVYAEVVFILPLSPLVVYCAGGVVDGWVFDGWPDGVVGDGSVVVAGGVAVSVVVSLALGTRKATATIMTTTAIARAIRLFRIMLAPQRWSTFGKLEPGGRFSIITSA